MKTNYNFLGSGGPIRYRGIFSGLSNETMGTASCLNSYTPAPDPVTQQVLENFYTYQAALFRYASIRTRNKLLAAIIIDHIKTSVLPQCNLLLQEDVRNFIFNHTRQCCEQWLLAKPETLYQRKPKNPT
jgi:hypothetical protein